MQDEEKGKDKKVDIKIEGEIDLPEIDVKPYIGKKANIESADVFEGQHGYYVKVLTEVVDTLEMKGKDDKPIEMRGSAVFGLQKDEEGKVGWGKKTKMGVFLEKMKVKHFNDLKGKEVILQKTTNKYGRAFLSFVD